ncbi:hypothetical protein A2T98_10215 [Nodularia spumigena CENA596]|uniref:Uncharacterized protein n=1 Tax=Nodularia spumigena CENA596 TaxID=1819295 RepID=A0A161XMG7_NODSP|nr:hypothetical protein A2T98_10215 [Nodularia spumigena CENA596]
MGDKLHSERDIGITVTQSLSVVLITIMGFANRLSAEIAANYSNMEIGHRFISYVERQKF